jgi:hypothetical protein
VGVLVTCVLVFTVFLYCFFYVYLFLIVSSVRTTATEWNSIAVSDDDDDDDDDDNNKIIITPE